MKEKELNLTRFLFVILFIQTGILYSQNIEPFRITPDDTPFFNTYEGVFDSLGFYWVGTNKGLYRYSNHRNFELTYTDTIPGKAIYGMQDDAYGTIWFLNDLGKLYYLDKLQPVKYPFPDDIDISSFSIQPDLKKIIIYTQNKIYEVDIKEKLIELRAEFASDLILKEHTLSMIVKLIDDKLYTTYHQLKPNKLNGISIVSLEKKINGFIKAEFGIKRNLSKRIFRALNNQYIFIHCQHPDYLVYYNTITNQIKSIELNGKNFNPDRIETINIADEKLLSINTKDGSYLFDPISNTLKKIAQTKGKIVKNLKIHKGQIWFTTNADGVYVLNQEGVQFLNDQTYFTSLITKNNELIVTDGGKALIFRDNQLYKELEIVENDLVYSINEVGDNIEFATGKNRVKAFNKKTFKEVRINKSGLIYFSIKGKHYYFDYAKFAKEDSILQRTRYKCFKINNDSTAVYLGHRNGLDKLDVASDSIKEIDNGFLCTGINIDLHNRLWVSAASNGGLRQYINDTLKQHYTTNDILPGNTCRTIIIDSSIIWIATDNGLLLYNPENDYNRVISTINGLTNTDIQHLNQSSEYIYIMTLKGLFYLKKNSLPKVDSYPLSVHMDEVKIWEKDTTIQSNYILNHNDNNIYLKYLSNDFQSRGKYNYKYRMLGIDSNWTTTTSDINFARYPQLKPGNYTFEVYSSHIDDNLKSSVTRIGFDIKTHFADTFLFKALMLIATLALIFWVYVRIQKRKSDFRELEQNLESEKMKSLMQQINPHFIYNTLNSIQYFIFNDKKFEASKYLSNFSNLMRKNFEFWSQDYISLNDEINHIQNYLDMEKIRFEDQVEIDFNVDSSLLKEPIKIPPFIIQPFIENAFKHGLRQLNDAGQLDINFEKGTEYVTVTIKDNGIGRIAAKSKQIKKENNISSLVSIERRVQLLNNLNKNRRNPLSLKIDDLYHDTGKPKGTLVTIKFPI